MKISMGVGCETGRNCQARLLQGSAMGNPAYRGGPTASNAAHW